MNGRTSANGLHGLVAITAAFTIGLHQIGGIANFTIDWSDPIGWLASTTTEDVIGATLRQIGLIIAYWILGSTALYVVAGIQGQGRRPSWVTLVTHRWIRKVADRAFATTLAVSILTPQLGIALAESPPPPPIVFEATTDGIPVPHVRMTTADDPSRDIDDGDDGTQAPPPRPTPVVIPTPVGATETSTAIRQTPTHTVVSGDHLWSIAATHLERTLERKPEQSMVTQYWQQVIESNVATLRSGDPNLIYPGELIALPAIGDGT